MTLSTEKGAPAGRPNYATYFPPARILALFLLLILAGRGKTVWSDEFGRLEGQKLAPADFAIPCRTPVGADQVSFNGR